MKKIFFITVVMLCAALQTTAQLRDTSLNTNPYKVNTDQYFQKAKKQKTVGWVLLGTGSALLLGSVIDVSKNALSGSDFWGYAALAGIIMDVSSIPFFISSGKNKRKTDLILKNESVFLNSKAKEHLVSAGLKINL